jgi:hypothetical protein
MLGPIPHGWWDIRIDVDEDISHVIATTSLVVGYARTAFWLLFVAL